MPWTGQQFKEKHNHSLTDEQADHTAKVADAILEKTGDEASAIRIANWQAGQAKYKSSRSPKQ